MRYSVSKIVEKRQSKVFARYGAFFAFSNKQFNEAQNPNVMKYVAMGAGLIAPKENAIKVMDALDAIEKFRVRAMKAQKSKKELILDALANYECQITGDISDAVDDLKAYGISEEEVRAEYPGYMNYCIENDYF